MPQKQKKALHKNSPEDYQKARNLRQSAPPAERILWQKLRMRGGFRRQHPLHPFIVDFVHLKAKLVIEIDGFSHDLRQAYDARRDSFLSKQGFKVLRFANEEILKNTEGVVETILLDVEKRANGPLP